MLDDFLEQRIGIDEHEAALLANDGSHEVASIAHADEGFVGVDNGHAVAEAIGVELEMVLGDAAAEVGVGAEKLLDYDGVESHGATQWWTGEWQWRWRN